MSISKKTQDKLNKLLEQHGFNTKIEYYMKEEKKEQINEGGHAVSNIVPIDQANVEDTIKTIDTDLFSDLKINLKDNARVLGSAGKKGPDGKSGDLDIAVDIDAIKNNNNLETDEDVIFIIKSVASQYAKEIDVNTGTGIISLPWKIENKNGKQNDEYVQLDLMLVNHDKLDFVGFSYWSPDVSESKYKGLYRNIILMAIVKNINFKVLEKKLNSKGVEVPVTWERMFFDLRKGLLKGKQTILSPKTGNITKAKKAFDKEFLSANKDEIIEMVLGPEAKESDLNSFETILNYMNTDNFIHKNMKDKILNDTKKDIETQKLPVPKELEQIKEEVKQINELLSNYKYKFPSDKSEMMFDFYMSTFLGNTGDADLDNAIQNAKETLYPTLKKELLDALFFSVSAEIRHVFDNDRPQDVIDMVENAKSFTDTVTVRTVSGKNIELKINYKHNPSHLKIFKKYMQTFGGIKQFNVEPSKERIKKLGGSRDVMKDSNRSYVQSYKAAINASKGKPEEFIEICKLLYMKANWASAYGGKAWAGICEGYTKLFGANTLQDMLIRIDVVYDLQHNTNTVFNKIKNYSKNGYGWILDALNLKFKAKEPLEFVDKISTSMKSLAAAVIKKNEGKTLEDWAKESEGKMKFSRDEKGKQVGEYTGREFKKGDIIKYHGNEFTVTRVFKSKDKKLGRIVEITPRIEGQGEKVRVHEYDLEFIKSKKSQDGGIDKKVIKGGFNTKFVVDNLDKISSQYRPIKSDDTFEVGDILVINSNNYDKKINLLEEKIKLGKIAYGIIKKKTDMGSNIIDLYSIQREFLGQTALTDTGIYKGDKFNEILKYSKYKDQIEDIESSESNNNKKYELTEETKSIAGITLYRIRALKDFGNVKKGDLGGWIEKEGNLSHGGNCWVYNNASVSGDARVYGGAEVSRDAWVYGNAWVYNNAQVFGNARVSGDAWVFGNAEVSGNTWVFGNARISGDAEVFGNAKVSGDAQVFSNAEVSGDASVFGNARVSGDAQINKGKIDKGVIKSQKDAKEYYDDNIKDSSEIDTNDSDNKKYELTNETMVVDGINLYRIRALKDFGNAEKGELGGWIEKEENLSHGGNCWVFDDAQVFGNAEVSGDAEVSRDAWVSGDAQVYGNAKVFSNASVFDDAEVFGNARVSGDAQVYGNARVYGNAEVSGDAGVYGNAQVYGNARVSDDAGVYGDAKINKGKIDRGVIKSQEDAKEYYDDNIKDSSEIDTNDSDKKNMKIKKGDKFSPKGETRNLYYTDNEDKTTRLTTDNLGYIEATGRTKNGYNMFGVYDKDEKIGTFWLSKERIEKILKPVRLNQSKNEKKNDITIPGVMKPYKKLDSSAQVENNIKEGMYLIRKESHSGDSIFIDSGNKKGSFVPKEDIAYGIVRSIDKKKNKYDVELFDKDNKSIGINKKSSFGILTVFDKYAVPLGFNYDSDEDVIKIEDRYNPEKYKKEIYDIYELRSGVTLKFIDSGMGSYDKDAEHEYNKLFRVSFVDKKNGDIYGEPIDENSVSRRFTDEHIFNLEDVLAYGENTRRKDEEIDIKEEIKKLGSIERYDEYIEKLDEIINFEVTGGKIQRKKSSGVKGMRLEAGKNKRRMSGKEMMKRKIGAMKGAMKSKSKLAAANEKKKINDKMNPNSNRNN